MLFLIPDLSSTNTGTLLSLFALRIQDSKYRAFTRQVGLFDNPNCIRDHKFPGKGFENTCFPAEKIRIKELNVPGKGKVQALGNNQAPAKRTTAKKAAKKKAAKKVGKKKPGEKL